MDTANPPQAAPADPHPDTSEIIRQVEFYFSDENLPGDAHLLGQTGGDGNGAVSINHILGFRKMRGFKPKRAVIQSLKLSENLVVIDDKYIQRRFPLTIPLRANPEKPSLSKANEIKTLAEKPWMTKRLLKPTGFEDYANDGPITPAEYEHERTLYHPDESIDSRLESAVARYMARRKMHMMTLKMFSRFLIFGGWTGAQRQFTGRLDAKAIEDKNLDADEVVQMKSLFQVSDIVLDGLLPDPVVPELKWKVEFETHARAFLSSPFMREFDWWRAEVVLQATNIMKNFYNYLLYHDVCPDFTQDIQTAIQVCNLAANELPRLAKLDSALPGDFNIACSVLFGGHYVHEFRRNFSSADEPDPETQSFRSSPASQAIAEARVIVSTALLAHGSEQQIAWMENLQFPEQKPPTVITHSFQIGLEVASVDRSLPSLYTHPNLVNTFLRPTGKMTCTPWHEGPASHMLAPVDAPASHRPLRPATAPMDFIIESDILALCFPGAHIEATVMQIPSPTPSLHAPILQWIDSYSFVYPTFYTWTLNELIPDYCARQKAMGRAKRRNLRDLQNVQDGDAQVVDGAEGDVVEDI